MDSIDVSIAGREGAPGPTATPWTQPPLRKLGNEIHDNATQMMILGKIILDLGDLMEKHLQAVNKATEKTDEHIRITKQLIQTLENTLNG